MASIILGKADYTGQTSAGKDATGAGRDGHVCSGIVGELKRFKKNYVSLQYELSKKIPKS